MLIDVSANPTTLITATVAVFLGGALGGLARWALSQIPADRVGTFAANMAGATILGFVAGAPEVWQLAAGVGFAGALSTWSTLAKEIGELIKTKNYGEAARYVAWTAVLGIVSAYFGLMWGARGFA